MKMNSDELYDIFEKFNSLKALVIGDVMVDSYLWGSVDRISPEAPVPIVSVNKRENRLGGAANVALNLQALGATPFLCSVIGDESKGGTFMSLLQSQGLSNEGIITSNKRITTTKFRVIGNNSQMLRVDEEIDSNIQDDESEQLFEAIKKLTEQKKINVIIFEDYDKGVITSSLITKVAEFALGLNIPIAVDPKKRNFKDYKNITLFKPNLKELKEGLKLDTIPQDSSDLKNPVDELQIMNNIDYMMVTLSEAGVYFSHKEKNTDKITERQTLPAHIRNIADVSGAGDTVISVAALCLALRLDMFKVAALSNLAGGLVCEEVGVVPVNKDKLLKESLAML